jgi:hypothetical protein
LKKYTQHRWCSRNDEWKASLGYAWLFKAPLVNSCSTSSLFCFWPTHYVDAR